MEVFAPEPFEVPTEAVGHYWGTAFAYELVDSRWAEDEDPQWLLRGVRADSLGGLPVAVRIPFGGAAFGEALCEFIVVCLPVFCGEPSFHGVRYGLWCLLHLGGSRFALDCAVLGDLHGNSTAATNQLPHQVLADWLGSFAPLQGVDVQSPSRRSYARGRVGR